MENGEILEISVFGALKLKYGDKIVGIENSDAKSKKMWIMLEYVLLNRKRKIPHNELIDILWPDMNVSDPTNSLKVLVFKLRKELDKLEPLQGKEIFKSVRGSYMFNLDIPYIIDAEEFDKLIKQSESSELEDGEEEELLLKAVELYKGVALVDAQSEYWALSIQTSLNNQYVAAIERLTSILTDKGEFKKIVSLCKNALLIYPYEEAFYYYMIRAYAAMEDYGAAAEMYDHVKAIMSKEYSVASDQRFEDAYKTLMQKKPKKNFQVDEYVDFLREERNYLTSFNVEYGEFKQIYRYVARRLDRMDFDAYLCLYTLGMRKGSVISEKQRERNIKVLENALEFELRQGDVFSRVSPNQFGIIITEIDEEIGRSIAERIKKYFEKNKKDDEFGIIYSLEKIEPSEFEKRKK